MIERIKREIKLVESNFGELEVDPNLRWFIVTRWYLVPGWNKKEVRVLLSIPPGYPTTPPDNFFTDTDLRIENGGLPERASIVNHDCGQQWLQFSYHIEASDWQPDKDSNLVTFLLGVTKRLSEAN